MTNPRNISSSQSNHQFTLKIHCPVFTLKALHFLPTLHSCPSFVYTKKQRLFPQENITGLSKSFRSFHSVYYDRSIASPKTRVRTSASSSNFQNPVFSLRSSSSSLHLLPRLTFTSILPSIFSSKPCIRKQDVTNPISLPSFYCLQDISLLSVPLCNTCKTEMLWFVTFKQ